MGRSSGEERGKDRGEVEIESRRERGGGGERKERRIGKRDERGIKEGAKSGRDKI